MFDICWTNQTMHTTKVSSMKSLFSSSSGLICLLLILVLLFQSAATTDAVASSNETDRLALLEFKSKITDNPFGVMASWNSSIHFCSWYGVTCGRQHRRVIGLDLSSHNLAGSISPSIGNLTFLRDLNLHNNTLSSIIPPEVGGLRRLKSLDLRNNSLVGDIPANLSTCQSLIFVYLSSNKLSGKIPEEIGLLRNLQVLSLFINYLIGDIPSSIANLSSLQVLSVRANNLSGEIPYAFGQLKDLTILDVANNSFGGNMPPSIFNLSSMEHFSLYLNNFTGSLPLKLGLFFPNLRYIGITANQFTGSIPPSISNASNLDRLYLSINSLTGEVPNLEKLHKLERLNIAENQLGSAREGDLRFLSTLTNITNLSYIIASDNHFGGVLPDSISNLSSTMLMYFGLENNQIVGSIPAGIGNLKSLVALSILGNRLSGGIPEDIGELQMLQELGLDHNELTGHIPSSLGNLNRLIFLSLSVNNLQGGIPSNLGKCQRLLGFDISHNHLTSSIPSEVFTISSLSTFNLSQNRLTGVIPLEIGNLKALNYFDVSQNLLSGVIPSSLGSCLSLETLSMGDNFFRGTIPSSFAVLRGIQNFNLSHNNLSGAIPTFLESFNLQSLDLSFNKFSGAVPSGGVFTNASITSIKGNNMLCGATKELQIPACPFVEPKKRRLGLKLKLIIIIASPILIASIILISMPFWLSKKKSKEIVSDPAMNSILQVSYQTLYEATDEFSSTNLIRLGSYGSVYKGILDSHNIVAVKVFNLLKKGASRSFMVECEALRNIRHRNLLNVVTACSSIDPHGDDFKAIVYEFMANGSLDQWLHPNSELDETSGTMRELTFTQRLDIAIDIASALDYLHNQHGQSPIVHCDLKPSNVLLNERMSAQIGDFGLVKFFSEGFNNLPTNQTSSTGVRGTIGYTAPEYGMGSEVSTYGDMYSYGILLLEMFTGKKPTDDMFDDNMNLHTYVKMALPDQIEEIADVRLILQTTQDKGGIIGGEEKLKESLLLIFEIGVACSKETISERMNICDALAKLTMIRTINSAGTHEV